MKSGEVGTQLMPPVATRPMPVIIADVGPAPCPKTLPQSVSSTRWPSAGTEKAPKEQVAHLVHFCSAPMPRPEIANVVITKSSRVTTTRGVVLLMPKRMSRTVSSA